ncbi:MAG: Glutaminase [uncultured Sphingomonadaceae bacterium]|uniref:Glutaminase n=1 Tax=uncultured Sphingomonadaceae bacterium TaxID=169976 RepID=A0A6J4TJZ6_9SPHN|nr:MAG: Glutaminase [uncultured Sphingomonadaceae bacterium]
MDYQQLLNDVLSDTEVYRGHGTTASYIPALKNVDPRKLGIALVLKDGSSFVAGDADELFSIQSISKVFTLSLALQRVGPQLWNRVGREPSGSPFNAIVQLEEERGKPRNPMINAGAFVVIDHLIDGEGADAAFDALLAFMRERADDPAVDYDLEVARSEDQSGELNRSLAHFVRAHGNMDHPVEEVLSVYFRQCAITMSCRQLARAALYLAFDGVDPVTGDAVVMPSRSRRLNALMLTCGHYDNSGDFAFRVGLPGKSGVGGGIVAVVPGQGAVCVWSPGLNAFGTSLAGAVALEKFVERTGWSVFA